MSEKILPDLQACILCEEVRQEINGNFMLIGVLGNIAVPALPITAHKLCLFTRWCCGAGKFHLRHRIVLPDNTSVIARSEGEFQLASEEQHVTQVTIFGNVQFQQAGTHWVEVFLDEELELRFPLAVQIVSPPK
ncbi:MAG: hypothetical protein HY360_11290 [Verrucomicrobia bacterium]|nr:hypothetical protein [Verrucomicrobiota bacterium]